MAYDIGYKKPPKNTQFKAGQSGNPKGRPKHSKNIASLALKELSQTVIIQENGQSRKITKSEALVKSAMARAMKGDMRALTLIKGLEEKALSQKEESSVREQNLNADDLEIMANFAARYKPEKN